MALLPPHRHGGEDGGSHKEEEEEGKEEGRWQIYGSRGGEAADLTGGRTDGRRRIRGGDGEKRESGAVSLDRELGTRGWDALVPEPTGTADFFGTGRFRICMEYSIPEPIGSTLSSNQAT
jgi:hypothetical protein